MNKTNLKRKQTPLFGTKEWSDYNINCVTGCSHDCKYCYAKAMQIQYGNNTPSAWKNEVIRTKALSKRFRKQDDGDKMIKHYT